jgi:hypothetical protein
VHKNKFGNNCRKCHDENSFKNSKNISSFNHELTDFPLQGMHRFTDCAKCHKKSYTAPLKHNRCDNCHSDYHENQFKKNGGLSPDCMECHTVEGFRPSTYDLERHNRIGFNLDGAHLATPCLSCHLKGEKWNFRISDTGCASCHKNIHENFMDSVHFVQKKCTGCHSTTSWDEITFDHSGTKFPLQGGHQRATCRSCHFSGTTELPAQRYKGLAESCENCHQDIHYKQFEESGKNVCEKCHTFNNWSPDKFNHDDARFKLDGRHKNLKCIQCHTSSEASDKKYIVYKSKDISCSSCHL